MRILIVAGGTGGHVFPGLAVAEALQSQGATVAWIGTEKGIEARVVKEAQIPLFFIKMQGIRGHGLARKLKAPFQLLSAACQVMKIFKAFSPDLVLTLGGYVTAPVGLVAWGLRVPVIVHEQNAIFGSANQLLKRLATRTLVAFPNMGPSNRYIHTGNPLRQTIITQARPATSHASVTPAARPLRLLVLGGSLGALTLNKIVPTALAQWPAATRPEVWHQTGAAHLAVTETCYQTAGVSGRIEPFIQAMAPAYEWADLVIARAGALTIAEITAMGLPSILIPYPHAIDDHQTANASALAAAGGAFLIQQANLSSQQLFDLIAACQAEPERLRKMRTIAQQFAKPDATGHVTRICQEVYDEQCA